MMTIEKAVSRDPEILGGTLCFSGTRVPVRNLFDYLEGGSGIDTFLESFEWISREQVMKPCWNTRLRRWKIEAGKSHLLARC